MAVSINLKLERCASSRHVGFFCLCILTKMISCVILCGIKYGNPWVQWPDICLVTQGECSNVWLQCVKRQELLFCTFPQRAEQKLWHRKINREPATYEAFVTIQFGYIKVTFGGLKCECECINWSNQYDSVSTAICYHAWKDIVSNVPLPFSSSMFWSTRRVISDERGICMPAIGKVGRYSYNDIYDGVSMSYYIAKLHAFVHIWDTYLSHGLVLIFIFSHVYLPPEIDWCFVY